MKPPKQIIVIAGPNGAGKTTFAREFLTAEGDCTNFVNADLIAAGLSPFAPEKMAIEAGRLMLRRIARLAADGESFGFETTLSGMGYARRIPQWRRMGFVVKLIFLSLPSVELALSRVAARVREGGHDIPEAVVRRRFKSGLANLHGVYTPVVDAWSVYDNSGSTPDLLNSGENS